MIVRVLTYRYTVTVQKLYRDIKKSSTIISHLHVILKKITSKLTFLQEGETVEIQLTATKNF